MKKVIFEKTYYGFESIFDLDRDITECLNPDYNESAKDIPAEFGGTVTVVITYEDNQSPVAGDEGEE